MLYLCKTLQKMETNGEVVKKFINLDIIEFHTHTYIKTFHINR